MQVPLQVPLLALPLESFRFPANLKYTILDPVEYGVGGVEPSGTVPLISRKKARSATMPSEKIPPVDVHVDPAEDVGAADAMWIRFLDVPE